MAIRPSPPTKSPTTMRWGIAAVVIFIILLVLFFVDMYGRQPARTRVQTTSAGAAQSIGPK